MAYKTPDAGQEASFLARHNFLNDLLVHALLIRDGLPVTLGEGEGFRLFAAYSEPGWQPLTGTEAVAGKLPSLERYVKGKVKTALEGAVAVSLTVDLRKKSGVSGVVVGLTGHAVGSRFAIKSELLSVKLLPDGVPAADFVGFFADTIMEYQLQGRIVCLVSDNKLQLVNVNFIHLISHPFIDSVYSLKVHFSFINSKIF